MLPRTVQADSAHAASLTGLAPALLLADSHGEKPATPSDDGIFALDMPDLERACMLPASVVGDAPQSLDEVRCVSTRVQPFT